MAMYCPSRACYPLEVVTNGRNAKDENSYQGYSMKFRSQAEFVRFLPKHHLSWRYRIGDSHVDVAQLNLDGISLLFIPMKECSGALVHIYQRIASQRHSCQTFESRNGCLKSRTVVGSKGIRFCTRSGTSNDG
jgi:hypothetical protein